MAPPCKPVVNSNGERFPSGKEAAVAYKVNPSSISMAIRHGIRGAGVYWAYDDGVTVLSGKPAPVIDGRKQQHYRNRPIINSEGAEFPSIAVASRKLGIKFSTLHCSVRCGHKTHGCYWFYRDEVDDYATR